MAEEKKLAPHIEDGPEVERLRAQIVSTRIELGNTIDEIQERLSPARLRQEAKDSVKEATIGRVKQMAKNVSGKAGDRSRGIIDTVRENPVAVAMIGLGAGWLFMNARRRRHPHLPPGEVPPTEDRVPIGYESGYTTGRPEFQKHGVMDRTREAVSDAAHTVGERVSDVSDAVRTAAHDVSHKVSEVAGDVGDRVSDSFSRVSDTGGHQFGRARSTYEETPWVGAAVALALGAAAGMSIPHTRREDELIGDKRDELLDRARDTGREKLEAMRHVAEEVMDDVRPVAQQSLKQHAREEGLTDGRGSDSGPER